MADWQRVAKERLTKLKLAECRMGMVRTDIERKARLAIENAVHSTCLASLSSPTTKAMIDAAVSSLVRDLNLDKA